MKICGDKHKINPFLVFKGNPCGRIEHDFTSFQADYHYGVQEKAWVDERLVYYWINNVLGPNIETPSCGIIPIVILNSYKVHLMCSVVNRLRTYKQKCGISKEDALAPDSLLM